jgi:threonylcarbamoyladenosine tRNA methylthiotransferase MtaB
VNIASYNYNNTDFYMLLEKILNNTGNIRIRISSLEPEKINDKLIDIIKSKRICSHFHLPVQSGSDNILKSMKRRYNRKKVIENTGLLRKAKPDSFISADVIAGFPGETDDDFVKTTNLIEKCSFASMHIFRFSRRPGTKAYNMKPLIPERIVKERVKILAGIKNRLYVNYINKCLPDAEVILEDKVNEIPGYENKRNMNNWSGISGNYLRIYIINVPEKHRSGSLVKCRIINSREISHSAQKIVAEYRENLEF